VIAIFNRKIITFVGLLARESKYVASGAVGLRHAQIQNNIYSISAIVNYAIQNIIN
jgi:hypothetical protein